MVSNDGDARTGDAIGGELVGVVTDSGGRSEVVVLNESNDVGLLTGDATSTDGTSTTGDAIGGQVATVLAHGAASLDGTNRSEDVRGVSGDALTFGGGIATTGDAVGGQVLGLVTKVDGSADLVAKNEAGDVDVESGDAAARRTASSFTGFTSSSIALEARTVPFRLSADRKNYVARVWEQPTPDRDGFITEIRLKRVDGGVPLEATLIPIGLSTRVEVTWAKARPGS